MIGLVSLLIEMQGNPKAIILAGSPGAGKGSITGDLDLSGLKTLNLDDTITALSKADGFTLNQKATDAENRSAFMKAMAAATKKLKDEDIPNTIANKDSFILDGTSASSKQTINLYNQLKDNGYDVMMLYVYTDLETALDRNEKRFEKSGGEDRSLMPGAVFRTWNDVTKQYFPYKELFGANFVSVANTGDEDSLKDVEAILKTYISPFKVKDGKLKTEKELAKSAEQARVVNKEIQDFLDQNKVQDILTNSVTAEEAASRIQAFLS